MTLEDFAHRCLMIKAGNVQLAIPCCANCKYYVCSNEPYKTATAKGGIDALAELLGAMAAEIDIKSDEDPAKYECRHPVLETDDPFVAAWLNPNPEDFCSRWEERTC